MQNLEEGPAMGQRPTTGHWGPKSQYLCQLNLDVHQTLSIWHDGSHKILNSFLGCAHVYVAAWPVAGHMPPAGIGIFGCVAAKKF